MNLWTADIKFTGHNVQLWTKKVKFRRAYIQFSGGYANFRRVEEQLGIKDCNRGRASMEAWVINVHYR